MNLKVTLNLSDKVTFGLAQAQRVVHGRKSVEVGLKAALFERNHKLDHFFTPKTLQFKQKPKKEQKKIEKQMVVVQVNISNTLYFVSSGVNLKQISCARGWRGIFSPICERINSNRV